MFGYLPDFPFDSNGKLIGKYQFKGRHFSLSFIITNKAYMDQMC